MYVFTYNGIIMILNSKYVFYYLHKYADATMRPKVVAKTVPCQAHTSYSCWTRRPMPPGMVNA